MSDAAPASASAGTTHVRAGFALDEARLAVWMAASIEGFDGPLEIAQFKGGQSNPTYSLTTPDHRYVLRKKPPGAIVQGAHGIEREARVMAALDRIDFPVPRIHGLCEDDSIIGTSFYVMDMVDGRIFWDAALPGETPDQRAAIFDAMGTTIARLHVIDHDAIGLAGYGKTGNYLARQMTRWSKQYHEDPEAGRSSEMDRLIDWLQANIPADDATTIVHGDFRIDNMIFHHDAPQVAAVLDWELSTLGHPLVDFANHAIMYHMPPHIVAGLAGSPLPPGIPSETDYVAAYCRRTGRTNIPDYEFYLAFNFFRMAAIFHGIRGRALRGTAASAAAKERGESFFELASLGLEIATAG